MEWPSDKVERTSIKSITPYARNSRTHSDEQVAQIAASIKEWGFTTPILIDTDGEIIAGHGRLLAAQRLGLEEVPTMTAKGWSEAQKRAYVIADNKLALNAGWNDEMLKIELDGLKDLDFDLDLVGFSDDELAKLLQEPEKEGLTDEDEVPEAPEKPVTVEGDIWVLGNHRLMCGDSTSVDAVEKLMNGNKVDLLFTDPPYGIDFKPQRGTHDRILNDNLNDNEFNKFLDDVFSCAFSFMKDNTYAFIWTGWSKIGSFEKSIQNYFKIQAMHIWVKNNFGIGYYSRPKHEPFYLCLKGKPIYPEKAPSDVWEANKVNQTVHSCEKPVNLIINILDVYHKNSHILDLFGGSGSTLIACEKTNRLCYVMELDPKYCDVIIKRWQDFTGEKAVLQSSGKTFDDLKAENEAA